MTPAKMAKIPVQPRLTMSHPRRLSLACRRIRSWAHLQSYEACSSFTHNGSGYEMYNSYHTLGPWQ